MNPLGPVNALYPMPTTLVGATVKAKPNFLAVAHVGILNHGTLNATGMTISRNDGECGPWGPRAAKSAEGCIGGGIWNEGVLTINESVVSENEADLGACSHVNSCCCLSGLASPGRLRQHSGKTARSIGCLQHENALPVLRAVGCAYEAVMAAPDDDGVVFIQRAAPA